MTEPVLTRAEMAAKLGLTEDELQHQIAEAGTRPPTPTPNREQRRRIQRAGRKRGR